MGVNSVFGKTLHDFEIICPARWCEQARYRGVLRVTVPRALLFAMVVAFKYKIQSRLEYSGHIR